MNEQSKGKGGGKLIINSISRPSGKPNDGANKGPAGPAAANGKKGNGGP